MQEFMQFFSRHLILSIVWISLITAVLFTVFKNLISKVRIITCNEATRLVNKEDAVVVDLRQRDDFCNGHIVGAINLLPSEIKANNAEKLKKYRDKPIIIVNYTGMQTRGSTNALIKAGFKNVCVLKEGIFGWKEKNLPLVHDK